MYGELIIDTDDDCWLDASTLNLTSSLKVCVSGGTGLQIRTKAAKWLAEDLQVKSRIKGVASDMKTQHVEAVLDDMKAVMNSGNKAFFITGNMTFSWAIHRDETPFDLTI